MFDSLIAGTALPNLHPAVVHFPIACLPLALGFDVASLAAVRQRWLPPAATTLYVLGAASAWLAVWAGEQAADSVVGVAPSAQLPMSTHSDWGHYAFYSLLVAAAVRLAVHLRSSWTGHRGARVVSLLVGFATLAVLARAADLGGALVYEHGVAVRRSAEPAAEPPPGPQPSTKRTAPASARLVESDDGSVRWRPAPGDHDAFGTIVTAATGSTLDTVRWVEPETDDTSGMVIEVDGAARLLLPGTFGDVQIDWTLEPLGFEGALGLVHHAGPDGSGGTFTLSTEGSATLTDIRDGASKTLDTQPADFPASRFVLSVSSAGRHLKGLIDGRMVAHGHVAPGPPGRCGLVVEGTGRLRVIEWALTPLGE